MKNTETASRRVRRALLEWRHEDFRFLELGTGLLAVYENWNHWFQIFVDIKLWNKKNSTVDWQPAEVKREVARLSIPATYELRPQEVLASVKELVRPNGRQVTFHVTPLNMSYKFHPRLKRSKS